MKKLMFTAIALVAFSSASMANTIADEEVVKDNSEVKKEVTQQQIEALPKNCALWAANMTCLMDPDNNLTDMGAFGMYQAFYETCMKRQ
ncbi:hypothetical protein [Flavobacterium sp.]|jgi:hypothetical protein|uniref:hypothetical protein n=1 Tax=Flavobacterium sp. TaxID=239 RepID=UPI0037BE422E